MKVLFICKGNWFRSQMAAAIYNDLTQTQDADLAGTYTGALDESEGQILSDLFSTPDFFEIMEKHGLYVRANTTKRLMPAMLRDFDKVVSMAEEPYVPAFLKNDKKVIWWEVENPETVDTGVAEETYEKLNKLIKELIEMS